MKHASIIDITGNLLFSDKLEGQCKINLPEQINQAVLYFMSIHTSSRGITKKPIK